MFVPHLFDGCVLQGNLSLRLCRLINQDGGDVDTAIVAALNG